MIHEQCKLGAEKAKHLEKTEENENKVDALRRLQVEAGVIPSEAPGVALKHYS